ncbi:hypothetical protein [Paenibacillus sp. IHBB 10380]|uniref:hypothetical protein n=1 Tax=Paenibacillus sp. IHBB 10380 TaxID=1566358 RepID=UPI0006988D71|nr:hypothetical protein [Paenibacillus sp. IHBB 10380]
MSQRIVLTPEQLEEISRKFGHHPNRITCYISSVASVKDWNLKVGAKASLNKYEGGIDIPLPFTDKDLNVGGSASLGVVGASAEVGKDGLKFHVHFDYFLSHRIAYFYEIRNHCP